MTERTLEQRYRLLAASFRDTERAAVWRQRLGALRDEALELLVFTLGRDLAHPPDQLDRERLHELLGSILPGRLTGQEPYRTDLVDLLEDLLMHVVIEEGLTTSWEWSSALDEGRALYSRALQDPHRPTPGTSVKRTPERRPGTKIGRNDPCPCGSGRKFKQCCWRLG